MCTTNLKFRWVKHILILKHFLIILYYAINNAFWWLVLLVVSIAMMLLLGCGFVQAGRQWRPRCEINSTPCSVVRNVAREDVRLKDLIQKCVNCQYMCVCVFGWCVFVRVWMTDWVCVRLACNYQTVSSWILHWVIHPLTAWASDSEGLQERLLGEF